jgi:hypothetical protein
LERERGVCGGDLVVAVSPAPSVAMTVIVFSPTVSVTFAPQSSVPLAGSLFTVADAMPDASEAVPAMTSVAFEFIPSIIHLDPL